MSDDEILNECSEGIERTVINLLKAGSDLKFISSVTGLTLEQLQKLKARL